MKKKILIVLTIVLVVALAMISMVACNTKKDDSTIRIGALTGPTAIGILNLKNDVDTGANTGKYTFDLQSDASVISASLVKGDLDIALVPCNVASKLYNNPNIDVKVIDINATNVLYCVTGATSTIASISDLNGKEVLVPNQGTMPDAVSKFLFNQYGITVNVTYSTPDAIKTSLVSDNTKIGILPQPAAIASVVAASSTDNKLKLAFSLGEAWTSKVTDGSEVTTGVTIVRSAFLKDHESLVKQFLVDHKASVEKATKDEASIASTAELVVAAGILPKAPVAVKAIPLCGLACITGQDMKTKVSGCLTALHSVIPDLTGNVPGDDFYYLG